MEFDGFDTVFWIKFVILFLIFGGAVWFMAPTLKWKLMFTPGVAVGIFMALMGKSLRRRG